MLRSRRIPARSPLGALALASLPLALAPLALLASLASCDRAERRSPPPPAPTSIAPPSSPPPEPVHIEDVSVPGDLTVFAVRGARAHRLHMLFVPGMCVHPGGYIQAFQHTAAARGDLVAVQGDVSCGGDGAARRWSGDLDAMDRRITAAFRAAGLGEPRDVVVIGYSQGAERAERLVARWPERYTSAILIASPVAPSPVALHAARAVVLMAGTLDGSQSSMKVSVGPLLRAGVPATYLSIPGARHGQMGERQESTMREALDFVEQNRLPPRPSGGPSHRPSARR